MVQTNVILRTRGEDALGFQTERLSKTLEAHVPGRERDWAGAVGEALAGVERALRQHMAVAQAPNGVFAEVDNTRPTLARQADGLLQEHGGLLDQCLALQREVQRAAEAFAPSADLVSGPGTMRPRADNGGVLDFGSIRQQVEQFVSGLRTNRHAETQLVLESINTDIGVGD
jgi:hypothetical protein